MRSNVNGSESTSILTRARARIHRYQYEFLLVALLQHLFVPAFLLDLEVYARVLWPLTVLLLGFFSVGIFVDRSLVQRRLKQATSLLVVVFPVLGWVVRPTSAWMVAFSLSYLVFFVVIFAQVLAHIVRPKYVDVDLILAAICGYLLLLETSVCLMQALYFSLPNSFAGIDTLSLGSINLDLVYFCSIVLTSIGLGDITPEHHVTKLATSMVGILGQIYSVVLVGILISKYAATAPGSRQNQSREHRSASDSR